MWKGREENERQKKNGRGKENEVQGIKLLEGTFLAMGSFLVLQIRSEEWSERGQEGGRGRGGSKE